MIYLDTSAFIKLYLLEDGSEEVNDIVRAQDEPLPVWELQEMELVNALRLKVFRGELSIVECDGLIEAFRDRRRRGLYYMPDLDRTAVYAAFYELSRHTHEIGCRTLDVLHVACARHLTPRRFVTYDERQRRLAERAGLPLA